MDQKGLCMLLLLLYHKDYDVVSWFILFYCLESFYKIVKKVMFHPCIIAVYIGLFLMIFPIKLPYFLNYTIKNVGNCTTSISMILIGAILGEMESIFSIFSKTTFNIL